MMEQVLLGLYLQQLLELVAHILNHFLQIQLNGNYQQIIPQQVAIDTWYSHDYTIRRKSKTRTKNHRGLVYRSAGNYK